MTPLDPAALSKVTLEAIVRRIQAILWLDLDNEGDAWNPDKDWDSDTLTAVADALSDWSLRP